MAALVALAGVRRRDARGPVLLVLVFCSPYRGRLHGLGWTIIVADRPARRRDPRRLRPYGLGRSPSDAGCPEPTLDCRLSNALFVIPARGALLCSRRIQVAVTR